MRWTLITDKWVPYIFLVKGEDTFNKVYDLELSTIKSQYKDASHFKFKALNKFKITDNDQLIGMSSLQDKNGGNYSNFIKADTYYVCVIGMHWTHEQFYDEMSNVKALFNFCCDYLYHPKKTETPLNGAIVTSRAAALPSLTREKSKRTTRMCLSRSERLSRS